jgi:benzaldehyde dehydrogenase (NAD)
MARQALCTDPNIAMIQFTGSTGAGRMVGQDGSEHLRRSPSNWAVKTLLSCSTMQTSNWRSKCSLGHMVAPRPDLYVGWPRLRATLNCRQFSRLLAEKAKALPVGDPATSQVAIGPIINSPVRPYRQRREEVAERRRRSFLQGDRERACSTTLRYWPV